MKELFIGDKTMIIALLVGLVIGFVGGVFVMRNKAQQHFDLELIRHKHELEHLRHEHKIHIKELSK